MSDITPSTDNVTDLGTDPISTQNNGTDHKPDTDRNAHNDATVTENGDASSTDTDDIEITPEMQAFYERADAIIELANSQLSPKAHSGQVGASLLYAAARYSASVASIGFVKADDFAKETPDIIEFYVKQYRQMLSDNLADYAQHFDQYVQLNQAQNTDQ